MDHLDEITLGDLQDALDALDGTKPTQRLVAAIAYKNGVTQTELAEWFDVERRTIYSWLERLDTDAPLERAVADDKRPGRPRKTSEEEQEELVETLADPPTEVGFDAPAWTPTLVQQYLGATYDVDYSIPSCRRLLREAGLRYRPRRATGADDADQGDESPDDVDHRHGRWTPE